MRQKLCAALLALALLVQLPVFAASNGTPAVVCTPGSASGSAQVSLSGLTDKVYAAQVELVWNTPQSTAAFTPSGNAYSPRCLVQNVEGKSHVTIYVDLTASPTEGAAPALGTLQLGGAYTAPVQARLTLLDRDLKPYTNANGAWVSLNGTGNNNNNNNGNNGNNGNNNNNTNPPPTGGSTYWITTTAITNGTLRVDPVQARPDTVVTVYATPDTGYKRVELSAIDASGQRLRLTHVRDDRYTFTMPASPVSVSAVFARQDTERPDPNPDPGNTNEKELPFSDVRTKDWFYDAVSYVYNRGLMSGTEGTLFSPNVTTTRAMIVAILYKLEGQPDSGLSDFTDVPAHQYYAGAVSWAASHGIVSGYGGGLFGPNDPITREQMARILFQYAQMKGYSTQARADLSRYSDAGRISGYAKDAMSWANALGLINGLDDGRLSPGGGATRAQAASIVMNFCEKAAQ